MNIYGEESFLRSYNPNDYERPSVAVDIAAFSTLSSEAESYKRDSRQRLMLLLVRRGCYPFMSEWALPGGFLRPDETIEQCAVREISEETNVTPSAILPAGVFSKPDRDPRGRVISHAFVSVIGEKNLSAVGGGDAQDARWFDFSFSYRGDELCLDMKNGATELHSRLRRASRGCGVPSFEIIESGGLSFDHAAIIASALDRLQSAADSFEVIFYFLPEKFTITRLQQVQEAILNISLLPANFRRKISAYIEETDEYVTGAGHRPAKLFKRKTGI